MKPLALLFTCLFTILTIAHASGSDWIELFNGKDLNGWVQRGGKAKYEAANNCIVGRTVLGTGNSFLCTEANYGDFILELEFRVDPKLNSGVQIRSECFADPKTANAADGQEIKIPAGRVHGYQIEIDMEPANKRWWTTGIYDEARRGWLYPGSLGGDKEQFTQFGARLSKQSDWNHIRVEAKGDTIKTWLNGEPRAEIQDFMTPRGFIALQVHGVGNDKNKENLTVQFRHIRLKPL